MYRDWPFFQILLSNMDMVLAKSDIAIASRYAELVCDEELRVRVFSRLRAEWQNTIEALLAIMGHHMQIELVKRYRAGDTDQDVVTGIHLTINGIAAGLRNSG